MPANAVCNSCKNTLTLNHREHRETQGNPSAREKISVPLFLRASCSPCGKDFPTQSRSQRTFLPATAYHIQEDLHRDRVPTMVLSLHSLLAAGLVGVDHLPDRVAALATLPFSRHSRARSLSPGVGRSNASRAPAERTVSSVENLKLKLPKGWH